MSESMNQYHLKCGWVWKPNSRGYCQNDNGGEIEIIFGKNAHFEWMWPMEKIGGKEWVEWI